MKFKRGRLGADALFILLPTDFVGRRLSGALVLRGLNMNGDGSDLIIVRLAPNVPSKSLILIYYIPNRDLAIPSFKTRFRYM